MQDWLKKHKFLWWWVKDPTRLSRESVLEGVMNYGDWPDFLYLKKQWGLKEIKKLFIKMTGQRRVNLHPLSRQLFGDYLAVHAL